VKPPKPKEQTQDWVWRISEATPLGEWVDRHATPATIPLTRPSRDALTDLPEVSTGGWLVSSYDLLSGTDVVDEGSDSVPMDLFDELFPLHRGAAGEEPPK
jgi:hypothetical protein